MFLDHKTLYYDVDPFMFYVLVEWRDQIEVDKRLLFAAIGTVLLDTFPKKSISR